MFSLRFPSFTFPWTRNQHSGTGPVTSPRRNRIEDLPVELLAHVFAVDRTALHTFQLISKKAREAVVFALQSQQNVMIQEFGNGSPLCQRIASYSCNMPTSDFHERVYVNTCLYGGKWGLTCPPFASPEEILSFNREIQRRKGENLLRVWGPLRQLIVISSNPGPELPGAEASPDAIERWMQNNLHLCRGITLRSLPLDEAGIQVLQSYVEVATGAAILPAAPIPVTTTPVIINHPMALRYRLAADVDHLLRIHGYSGGLNAIKVIDCALESLRQHFELCAHNACGNNHSENTHTSINVRFNSTEIDFETCHDNTVQLGANSRLKQADPPPITLHFYLAQNRQRLLYIDEISWGAQMTENVHQQLISSGFSSLLARQQAIVDTALYRMRLIYLENVHHNRALHHVSQYIRTGNLTVENRIAVEHRIFSSHYIDTMRDHEEPIDCPVTLRLSFPPDYPRAGSSGAFLFNW